MSPIKWLYHKIWVWKVYVSRYFWNVYNLFYDIWKIHHRSKYFQPKKCNLVFFHANFVIFPLFFSSVFRRFSGSWSMFHQTGTCDDCYDNCEWKISLKSWEILFFSCEQMKSLMTSDFSYFSAIFASCWYFQSHLVSKVGLKAIHFFSDLWFIPWDLSILKISRRWQTYF